MTRLLIALGIAAFAATPALAGGKHIPNTHKTCKDGYYGASCAKRKLVPYSLSHPRKSYAVVKQFYVSKGFGR